MVTSMQIMSLLSWSLASLVELHFADFYIVKCILQILVVLDKFLGLCEMHFVIFGSAWIWQFRKVKKDGLAIGAWD